MKIFLLGPVEVTADDATPVAMGGVRLRMLLARLALEGGRPVSVDALVDGLWGEQPPADAGNALQALVSRLRRALRGTGTVDSVAGGYRIAVNADDADVARTASRSWPGRAGVNWPPAARKRPRRRSVTRSPCGGAPPSRTSWTPPSPAPPPRASTICGPPRRRTASTRNGATGGTPASSPTSKRQVWNAR